MTPSSNEYQKGFLAGRIAEAKTCEEARLHESLGFSNSKLEKLALEIRTMSVRSNLYKMLKSELLMRGWWKNRKRGKPAKF